MLPSSSKILIVQMIDNERLVQNEGNLATLLGYPSYIAEILFLKEI